MSTQVLGAQLQTARSATEKRAIELLGSGLPAATVATALGISESRISQYLAQEDFKAEVSTLRFQNLQKHNEMDNAYDRMEAKVAKSLEETIPLMMKPMELMKAAQVLNSMKRRGSSSPDQMVQTNQVVQLLMPTVITQKFTTNINNQVINAGNQTLETIQGSMLLQAAKAKSQQALSTMPNNHVIENSISTGSSIRPSQELTQQRVGALLDSKTINTTRTEQTASTGTATIYEPPV